jgi:hypothetical protein
MDWVKRLSIGREVCEPLDDHVVLGLSQVGWGTFEIPSANFATMKLKDTCRFYVGRSDKFTVLLLQGAIAKIENVRAGVQRITVRQKSQALEREQVLRLANCTAMDVLQEIVESTGLTFATINTSDPAAKQLVTVVPEFSSAGPLLQALVQMGKVFGISDAVWYEQPDGRIFWGSWSQTPVAQTPLPLQGNVIQDRDPSGHVVYIPVVGAIRPGMVMQAPSGNFRVDGLQLLGDRMRLEWTAAHI